MCTISRAEGRRVRLMAGILLGVVVGAVHAFVSHDGAAVTQRRQAGAETAYTSIAEEHAAGNPSGRVLTPAVFVADQVQGKTGVIVVAVPLHDRHTSRYTP